MSRFNLLYHKAGAATQPDPVTASATLFEFNGNDYQEAHLQVTVNGAVSGTSPTLSVSLESQTPDGTWFNVAATNNITAQSGIQWLSVGRAAAANAILIGRMRVRATVGGTTPSFTGVEVTLYGKPAH